MKTIRTLTALLIISLVSFLPAFAGNTNPRTDLKDLVFSEVKIEIADGAPNEVSLEKAITGELLSRGATQSEKGLPITGKAMFMKSWMGSTVLRISADLSTKGLSFADSADYSQAEITARAFGKGMKTEELVDKLKQKIGDTFATQLNARRAANDSKPRTGVVNPQR